MTERDTIETYQIIVDEYRERNADRTVIEDQLGRFLDAVEEGFSGQSARLADVGCGPGWESAAFGDRGHDVVAIDLTPAFLRVARETAPGAELSRMDMRTLGLDADVVDGLWVCASFLHVPREDAPATLSEFHRVLRSGGVLHLSVHRGEGERRGGRYDGDRRRFTLYRPDELRELVTAAGFAVDSVRADDWVEVLARA